MANEGEYRIICKSAEICPFYKLWASHRPVSGPGPAPLDVIMGQMDTLEYSCDCLASLRNLDSTAASAIKDRLTAETLKRPICDTIEVLSKLDQLV